MLARIDQYSPCAAAVPTLWTFSNMQITLRGKSVWDSGVVSSADSTYVPGPAAGLAEGALSKLTHTHAFKFIE